MTAFPQDISATIPSDIRKALQELGTAIEPLATAAMYEPLQRTEPYEGVRVTRDLAYGPDERHRLDVFAPAPTDGHTMPATPRPVLVFVHGGGFVAGDKRHGDSAFYDNIALWAVGAGCIGINITYRLAPGHPWPAAQEDLAAAIGWIRAHAAHYAGDPTRIILMGHSAGAAHVALYLAHPRFHAGDGPGVIGAVLVSGLFDTRTAEMTPPLQAYFGHDSTRYAERSALPGLEQARVPMLLFCAEIEGPEFLQQSRLLHDALQAAGQPTPFYRLLGHTHMSEVHAINSGDTSLTDQLQAFIMSLAFPGSTIIPSSPLCGRS